MKTASPALLPLLRSRAQGDIIARLFLDTDHQYGIVELAESVGVSPQQALREVGRLENAGLVQTAKKGNTRYVTVLSDNPVFKPLAELMAVTFGAIPILRSLIEKVPGVETAFIYGSWAARYSQDNGPVPGDIDVLIIGDTDQYLAREISKTASKKLRRDVSIRRMSTNAWLAERNAGFRQTVLDRPRVHLVGKET